MLRGHDIVIFSGAVSFKLQNKILVDSRGTRLRTFQFFEFDFVGQFAWVGQFRRFFPENSGMATVSLNNSRRFSFEPCSISANISA